MSKDIKEAEFDADVFDSMLHGSFEQPEEDIEETNDSDVESEVEEPAEDFDEANDDQEDTDQEEESEEDEELDEEDDGSTDEDFENEEDDEEEDTLVEDYDSDDEGEEEATEDEEEETEEDDISDEEDFDESEEEDPTEGSEDDAETEEQSDGDAKDTEEVDYKAFYDAVVNTEFVVNGKKVKGFADPKKIIQSQQMAGGFSEKMAGFKQYRPFMAPLKERGMLDDPAKFDLAMNLIDGDAEAIKQHLKSLDIDPIDLDMEQINYEPKQATASQEVLVIEDVMERAKSAGIEDRVRQVIGKEWDVDSFQEFIDNDRVREDLLEHIETGAYDRVQDKIAEMSRLDYNGAFGALTSVNKYRAAVRELQREAPQQQQTPTAAQANKEVVKKVPSTRPKRNTVKAEKAKIVDKRKEEKYKEKASKREAEIAKQRKRAASMSRKKPKAKPTTKFDPLQVEGEDLDSLMDFLVQNGSKIPTA